jgi:hypothetical protein
MKAFLQFPEDEIEASYYMFGYILENGFEFVGKDAWMNEPLRRVFDKIATAYEDMHAPIDEEEEEFLEERLK